MSHPTNTIWLENLAELKQIEEDKTEENKKSNFMSSKLTPKQLSCIGWMMISQRIFRDHIKSVYDTEQNVEHNHHLTSEWLDKNIDKWTASTLIQHLENENIEGFKNQLKHLNFPYFK